MLQIVLVKGGGGGSWKRKGNWELRGCEGGEVMGTNGRMGIEGVTNDKRERNSL